jgi:anaerobic selenocysteine-containing dehydrogenase
MKKIERKDFLTLTGGVVAGAAAGAVFSGAPLQAYQWLVEWTQDQYVPQRGEAAYLKSICDICPNSCELTVRKAGSRAVMVESSNKGCPFGHTALQALYHPERINKPYKLSGKKGSGEYSPVTWETAIKDIAAKLNGLISEGKGGSVAAISQDDNLSAELLDRIIKGAGSLNHHKVPTLASLNKAALGADVEYDFENADLVVSFGAKLFEGWGNPGRMNKALLKMKEKGVKIIQIDTNCTRTTSLADEWVAVKPGTEMVLALSMASHLIKSKRLNGTGAGFGAWSQYAFQYEPAAAEKITGVPEKKIVELAEAFAAAKNPAAVGGKGARGVSSSAAELLAVYGLNDLVRTRAVSLKSFAGYNLPAVNFKPAADAKASAGLDDFIKNGSFQMLFVNSANPVYKSVYGKELAEKMSKAFVVATAGLIDDTALYADYILPTLTYFEASSKAGEAAAAPYEQAKHAGDTYISIGQAVDALKAAFPWKGYTDLIKAERVFRGAGNFTYNTEAVKFAVESMKKSSDSAAKYPLYMQPRELPFVGDGDGLAYPYVLKTIDAKTYSNGRLWVEMNRETADKEGLSEGSSIKIISEKGKTAKVYVHLTDTTAPDVVVVPLGFGQKANTKYAKGKGINPRLIMSDAIDPVTGNADWWTTRVKIS